MSAEQTLTEPAASAPAPGSTLLEVEGLTKHFPVMGGFPFRRARHRHHAVARLLLHGQQRAGDGHELGVQRHAAERLQALQHRAARPSGALAGGRFEHARIRIDEHLQRCGPGLGESVQQQTEQEGGPWHGHRLAHAACSFSTVSRPPSVATMWKVRLSPKPRL